VRPTLREVPRSPCIRIADLDHGLPTYWSRDSHTNYKLLVIDHPHVGQLNLRGCLLITRGSRALPESRHDRRTNSANSRRGPIRTPSAQRTRRLCQRLVDCPDQPVIVDRHDALLRGRTNAVLATNRRDGGPQMTPNWYLWVGGKFLISTQNGTAKIKNIRRDRRVSLCIDDPQGGDYVTVYGIATIIEQADAREPTLQLLRKYRDEVDVLPHWERINRDHDRVVIVIEPERFVWRYE
jgi:PPOX class probable F420-dependent enzyme